ncbi:4-hydroxythreonine-4-phosphate dehydrogenase PdxA [Boseongicola aestuarii]|uniref:4-hydroxythreonine-4-phosphate dehydrogenase n=1 Tax=Boseongicola aestuarii TaxID=1470561 RepID=A0A238IUN8_9RHOB|nr:4-hydroxythreonine-4-phosphate dehydrogenase PdxA [Boseongicola aestuarii]SMX22027.1 4-hydroxythreonine-4-phosphate dehydrogenase [Boseongicola aestuarii]
MTETSRRPVALTCGDPAGVGPEIAVKAWETLSSSAPFFWIGDPRHLPVRAKVSLIQSSAEATKASNHGLPVLAHEFPEIAQPGVPSPANAQSVVDVIERAVHLVQSGDAAAVCTAPISKKILVDHAKFAYPGHTEFLAALGGVETSVMMLASEELKVVPVTIHMPLGEVPNALTQELLRKTLTIVHKSMVRDFGIATPRIAVAGLNPHAGEGGMLGAEEAAIIRPVCEDLRADGMKITDPLPADTMFHAKARKTYDVAVAMYHDQALIPIKTLAFDRGVNVTLGLPFVRTSPDHGTAFDIAGKGLADATSLVEAIRLAHRMASARITAFE